MSGETEANISGWTTDTLHTHLIRQIDLLREQVERQWAAERRATDLAFSAQTTAMAAALASAEKAVEAALAAQKEAVTVAATAAEKRADIQNEWRGSLNDVLSRAMPRSEAESVINRATERIQELITAQQHMITRAELDAIRQRDAERITELTTRVTRAESLAQGAQGNRTSMFAGLAAVGVLISVVVFIANYITGS